jgi:hypothetical protein
MSSFQEINNQIVDKISTILALDLSVLVNDSATVIPWNSYDSQEINAFKDDVIEVLKRLRGDKFVLNAVPLKYVTDLNNSLGDFISNFETLRNTPPDQVTSQHHAPLNNLISISDKLREAGLYTQLKLARNFDDTISKLKEANKQLKNFDDKQFENAISLVEDLTKKKVAFEEKTIKQSLGTFVDRASEHQIHRSEKFLSTKFSGQWWWLLFALICGSVVVYIVSSFISVLEANNNISIGAALLRVTSLAVPTYFMIFCINQFKYHSRMYEIYSFKKTSLNMMTDLRTTNPDKAEFILEKGLNVLFNEPSLKEDSKFDKQLINELITMLNNQMNKQS